MHDMPEILFIGNLPHPFGGVATHCLNLVNHLSKNGPKVHFLDTKPRTKKNIPDGIHYYEIKPQPIPVILAVFYLISHPWFTISLFPISWKDLTKLAMLIRFGNHIIQNNPNIQLIHSQHLTAVSVAASILKRENQLKLIVTAHGAEVTDSVLFSKMSHLISKVVNTADKIICVSNYTAKNLTDLFPQLAPKVVIIPNGVEKTEFKPDGLISRRKEILFVGDLHARKGADTLIEAFDLLSKPGWKLRIIGTPGNALDQLIGRIKHKKLDESVEISTNLSQSELIEAYAQATIFVFPTKSNTEGFGLVALEAMASGLVVIASEIAAIPEIVHHEINGLLFPPGDAVALANGMRRLIEEPNLRNQLVDQAHTILDIKYDWHEIASRTIHEYQGLLTS